MLLAMFSGWAVATRPRHKVHAHPPAFLARISWARYGSSRKQTRTQRIIHIWGDREMVCMWYPYCLRRHRCIIRATEARSVTGCTGPCAVLLVSVRN
jgi:hypothetical protein